MSDWSEASSLSIGIVSRFHDWSETSSVSSIDSIKSDTESREWHQRMCEEGNGWSHGFKILSSEFDDDPMGQELSRKDSLNNVIKFFAKENWQKMGNDISQCTNLKDIDLSHCELTEVIIQAFFGEGSNFICPLKSLYLPHNQLGPKGIAAMLPFLKSRSILKELNLGDTNLDVEATRLLSEALNHVRVERLYLTNNDIGDDGIEHLVSSENSIHLTVLHLDHNELGRRGYGAISKFLGRNVTALTELCVSCNEGDYAKMIIDSISSESNLERIYLRGDINGSAENKDPIISAIPNLQNLVCSMSSFESLRQSNLRLNWFGRKTGVILNSNPILKDAIAINERSGASAVQKIRAKLRAFYFQGVFDVQPFIDMDVELMPNVLQLLTRTESCTVSGEYYELCYGNLSGIFHLLRNCHLPELFSFSSAESRTQQLEAKTVELEEKMLYWKQRLIN